MSSKKMKLIQDGKSDRMDKVTNNPLFRQSRSVQLQNENKTVINDERFSAMFSDPNFKITTKDTRGRPILHTNEQSDPALFYGVHRKKVESLQKSDDESKDSDSDQLYRVDRARGIGLSFADEDEDSSDSEREDDSAVVDGEPNEDDYSGSEVEEDEELEDDAAPVIIEDATNRLAVENLDWSIIRARDLLVLFRSFCPEDGHVTSVTTLPSKFGIQRLAVERNSGPIELIELGEKAKGLSEEESERAVRRAIRTYQRHLCKYYIAVVECDSSETANNIYQSLDGYEFEKSGCTIHLSFIPGEMKFDDIPNEFQDCVNRCERAPRNYKNNPFFSKSKLISNISLESLTWDTAPRDRVRFIASCFQPDSDLRSMEQDEALSRVLRMSSSEDEDEDDEMSALRNKLAPRLDAAEMRALLLGDSEQVAESESEQEVATDEEEELLKYVDDVVNSSDEDVKNKLKSKCVHKKNSKASSASSNSEDVSNRKLEKNKISKSSDAMESVSAADEEIADESAKTRKKKGRHELSKKKKLEHKKKKRKLLEEKLTETDDGELALLLHGEKKRSKVSDDPSKSVLTDPRFAALRTDARFRLDPNSTEFKTDGKCDLNSLLTEQQKTMQDTEKSKSLVSKSKLTDKVDLTNLGKQILGGMAASKTNSASRKSVTRNEGLLSFLDRATQAFK